VVVPGDANLHKILAANSSCRMRMMITADDRAGRDMMPAAMFAADESLTFVHQSKGLSRKADFVDTNCGRECSAKWD
jgi:hypothetical protein